MKNKITKGLIGFLNCITWYNGLAPAILKWKDVCVEDNLPYVRCPEETYDNSQLQIIWMIMVYLFGDYGTSPRSGWILKENKEAFDIFINLICTTELCDEMDYDEEQVFIEENIKKLSTLMN